MCDSVFSAMSFTGRPVVLDNSSVVLELVQRTGESSIYSLNGSNALNRYLVVSDPGTRRLMASPKVVGFDSYLAMLAPTVAALQYLKGDGLDGDFDILTILRGGLNYPLEEAAYRTGMTVKNMHFLSCERVIENKVVTGLDIKYEKLRVGRDVSIMIGDIIASGDTLRMCFQYLFDKFRREGGSIRRIVFFTIGGTKAIDLMERFTEQIRVFWPEFEGFTCVFYEGIFTVYEDKGVTGVNVPNIDFGWKGGVIAPDFRRYVLATDGDALFEKCIIYDGGARRYEIPVHFEEVREYWNDILGVADRTDMRAFLAEKIGYDFPISHDDWCRTLHYGQGMEKDLYDLEQEYIARTKDRNLAEIALKKKE